MGEHMVGETAFHQQDGLDEFFDFSRFEQNSDAHAIHGPGPTITHQLDWGLAMDWQPTVAEDAHVLPALPFEDVLDSFPMHEADHVDCLSPTTLEMPAIAQTSNNFTAIDSLTSSYPLSNQNNQTPSIHTVSDSMLSPLDITSPSNDVSVPPAPLKRKAGATRKPASATRKGASNRIPLDARHMLEEEFTTNPYPCSWEIDIIAHQANLDVKRVRNWFNNTRARKKGSGMSFIQAARSVLVLSLSW